MTTKDTSGPAFPSWDSQAMHRIGTQAMDGITDPAERDRAYIEATVRAAQGMTLRQYYAGQALAGFCANPAAIPTEQCHFDCLAEDAWRAADAMLKARTE